MLESPPPGHDEVYASLSILIETPFTQLLRQVRNRCSDDLVTALRLLRRTLSFC
ncbi:hypothetical protein VCRA2110O2_30366 [Vibrio crassostreae]|nr:hypothetical protein VCHA44O286_50012 [Vibrio chagasii]CAK2878674.1 hypothetical protein VCRA2110O2_30366 [Vibrio crassostreae]